MDSLLSVTRDLVFVAFVLSSAAAVGSWLVRTKQVSSFTPLGRFLRSTSDPVIKPVETRLVRAGGNPVHAGIWLVVAVAVVGLVLLAVLQWVADTIQEIRLTSLYGPRHLIGMGIEGVYDILWLALMVRIIGTWVGAFRYSRWVRPAYFLTDWLVEPIRKRLPPMGMFDWSVLVAWAVLWVARLILQSIIL